MDMLEMQAGVSRVIASLDETQMSLIEKRGVLLAAAALCEQANMVNELGSAIANIRKQQGKA